jgi:hypothetical protein
MEFCDFDFFGEGGMGFELSRHSTAWAIPPSPFCSGYFGGGGLMNKVELALKCDPPDLNLPSS